MPFGPPDSLIGGAAGPEMLRNAVAALEAIPGVAKASVRLVMSPPWSPDKMSDAARDELGFF